MRKGEADWHFTVAELRMSMTLKIYQGIRIFGRFLSVANIF